MDVTSPTGEQYTSFMPRIQKSARDNVCGLCDVVGHLEITSAGERVIRLLSGEKEVCLGMKKSR